MKTVLPSLGARPIDKTARAVIGRGEHWEPDVKGSPVFDTPQECKPPPESERDYVGKKRGRLAAVGFLHKKRNGKSVWLMRCDCGRYTVRMIASWLKGDRASMHDQCAACETTQAVTQYGNRSKATKAFRTAQFAHKLKTESGFSEEDVAIILRYKLPCDDLDWLRGVLRSMKEGRLEPGCSAAHNCATLALGA